MATDTPPEAAAVQIAVYRRMSPSARLRAGLELTEMGRRLLAEGVRRRHPEYSEEEAWLAFLRLCELFRKAYPGLPELAP